jgi:hypothetical protein
LTGTATGMEGRTGALTGARMGVPGGGGPVGEALGELSCSCWVCGSDLQGNQREEEYEIKLLNS